MERYGIDDLKLVYRVLHRHLGQNTELLDSEFLADLQRFLHDRATAQGVDVGDHGAWDAWLGNVSIGCAVRMDGRKRL